MGLKIFGSKGIDQKNNLLKMSETSLVEGQNIYSTISDEYKQRPGFTTDNEIPFPVGVVIDEVIFLKKRNEYIFIDYQSPLTPNFYSYSQERGLILHDSGIPGEYYKIFGIEFQNGYLFNSGNLTLGEFNYCMFYDGAGVYRAGLPYPTQQLFDVGAPVAPFWLLYYYQFIDNNGIYHYGPSKIENRANSFVNGAFDILLFNHGFSSQVFSAKSSFTIDKLNRTISKTLLGPSTVYKNSFLTLRSYNSVDGVTVITSPSFSSVDILIVFVEDVTATHVIISEESIADYTVAITTVIPTLPGPTYHPVHAPLSIESYVSDSETTGYKKTVQSHIVNVYTPSIQISTNTTGLSGLLSDVYDITTSKNMPPVCTSIALFGDQVVYCGASFFYDEKNRPVKISNDDLIFFSDISSGDDGFTVSESNSQLIGSSFDGSIVGAMRIGNLLAIVKTSSVYMLSGKLIQGEYNLEKIESFGGGGLSRKSIININDLLFFSGKDNIYLLNGSNVLRIGDYVKNIIEISSFENSTMAFDRKNYNLIITHQNSAFLYNIITNSFFNWTNVNATSGITIDNEEKIKVFTGTIQRTLTSSKNDDSIVIDAFIQTCWFTNNEPSLLKKITKIRTFAINNGGQIFKYKYFKNWDKNKISGEFEIDMTSSAVKTVLKNTEISMAHSVSFEIRNNNLNEGFDLTGYELEYFINQEVDKNVR